MKRALLFIVALLCLAGCTKDGTDLTGVWYSNTNDGKLFLELRSGGNGVAYFEGCSSLSAFWTVDGKTIKVTGNAFNKDFIRYEFGSGTVVGNDIIRLDVTISQAFSSDKTKNLTFTKQ